MKPALPTARYLRITETRGQRVIEAFVYNQPKQLPPPKEEKMSLTEKVMMFISLFGWGFLGVAMGNLLFVNL